MVNIVENSKVLKAERIRMYSRLPFWHIKNKRVLLRADLNVPLANKKIINDFRLQSLRDTIDYILTRDGTVILATHIGRPQKYDPNLSTKILLPWFKKHGYSYFFAHWYDHYNYFIIEWSWLCLVSKLVTRPLSIHRTARRLLCFPFTS